jgi:hypothetical protein
LWYAIGKEGGDFALLDSGNLVIHEGGHGCSGTSATSWGWPAGRYCNCWCRCCWRWRSTCDDRR